MTDMQETCLKLKQTQRSGLSSNANGFFYLSHQRSGQRLKSKNCLQVLSFEHLISFILKRLRHFSLRDMFSRSSWWNRLGHFSLRSRMNCWVSSPFRGRCGWGSIPIYHLLGSHTMQTCQPNRFWCHAEAWQEAACVRKWCSRSFFRRTGECLCWWRKTELIFRFRKPFSIFQFFCSSLIITGSSRTVEAELIGLLPFLNRTVNEELQRALESLWCAKA